MTNIMFTIIATVLMVLGIKAVTMEGNLLYELKERLDKKLGYLADPVIKCEWCMPSFYTIISFFLLSLMGVYHVGLWMLWGYPIAALGASFVSGVGWSLGVIIMNIAMDMSDDSPINSDDYFHEN